MFRKLKRRFTNSRYLLAKKHLKGEGIEIGALNSPLPLPFKAKVKYVDRMNFDDLME